MSRCICGRPPGSSSQSLLPPLMRHPRRVEPYASSDKQNYRRASGSLNTYGHPSESYHVTSSAMNASGRRHDDDDNDVTVVNDERGRNLCVSQKIGNVFDERYCTTATLQQHQLQQLPGYEQSAPMVRGSNASRVANRNLSSPQYRPRRADDELEEAECSASKRLRVAPTVGDCLLQSGMVVTDDDDYISSGKQLRFTVARQPAAPNVADCSFPARRSCFGQGLVVPSQGRCRDGDQDGDDGCGNPRRPDPLSQSLPVADSRRPHRAEPTDVSSLRSSSFTGRTRGGQYEEPFCERKTTDSRTTQQKVRIWSSASGTCMDQSRFSYQSGSGIARRPDTNEFRSGVQSTGSQWTMLKKSTSKKPEDRGLQVLTCTVESVLLWAVYQGKLELLFEVYGKLQMPVKTVSNTTQEFAIKGTRSTLLCVFYTMDRQLLEIPVGTAVRCVGRLLNDNRLQCLSLRPATPDEQKLAVQLVKQCNKAMQEIVADIREV